MYQNNTPPGKNSQTNYTINTNTYQPTPTTYSTQGSFSSNPQQGNLNIPSYQNSRTTYTSMIAPQNTGNSDYKPMTGFGKL
mgnify:CR=1 FL=1